MLRKPLQFFTPFVRRYSLNSDKHLALQAQLSEQAAHLRTSDAFLLELSRTRGFYHDVRTELITIARQTHTEPERQKLSTNITEADQLLFAIDIGIDSTLVRRHSIVTKMCGLVADIKKECAEVAQDQSVSGVKPK